MTRTVLYQIGPRCCHGHITRLLNDLHCSVSNRFSLLSRPYHAIVKWLALLCIRSGLVVTAVSHGVRVIRQRYDDSTGCDTEQCELCNLKVTIIILSKSRTHLNFLSQILCLFLRLKSVGISLKAKWPLCSHYNNNFHQTYYYYGYVL